MVSAVPVQQFTVSKGQVELHRMSCLPDKGSEDDMYVATLPFFPLEKRIYDIKEIKPDTAGYDAALSRDL